MAELKFKQEVKDVLKGLLIPDLVNIVNQFVQISSLTCRTSTLCVIHNAHSAVVFTVGYSEDHPTRATISSAEGCRTVHASRGPPNAVFIEHSQLAQLLSSVDLIETSRVLICNYRFYQMNC
jgi:hypothetical protein